MAGLEFVSWSYLHIAYTFTSEAVPVHVHEKISNVIAGSGASQTVDGYVNVNGYVYGETADSQKACGGT